MNSHEKEETALFQIGWALIGILLLLYLGYQLLFPGIFKKPLPCVFHALLKLYCPGCGGTRAVLALFHGRFLASFLCHPLVPYTAVVCGWFMISQTIERASRHRIKIAMRYRDVYLWIALALVAVNFIAKNALLLIWNIDLLKFFTL